MKTLNEDIKRMMGLMEAKHGVIYPLISEQTSAWENVQPSGKGSDSLKSVNKDFGGKYPLINPSDNLQYYAVSDNGIFAPAYIGAMLYMCYDSTIKPKNNQQGYQGRFWYRIEIYLSHDNTETLLPAKQKGQELYVISCAQNEKDFGFRVTYLDTSNHWGSGLSYYSLKDPKDRSTSTNYLGARKLQLEFAKNPVGYAPGLIKDINDELDKYGYPVLPTTFNLSTPVTI
jgi:hypothetical protein